jgi:hypothetical protein
MSKERTNALRSVGVLIDLAGMSVEDLEYTRDLIEEELETRSQDEMKEQFDLPPSPKRDGEKI